MQVESRKGGWRSWAGRYQGSDLKPGEGNLKEAQASCMVQRRLASQAGTARSRREAGDGE